MAKTTREQIGVDLPDPQKIEAQEVERPEEEVKRPEWLPEKFKDEGEFAASYKALEDELRQRGESQKALEGKISQLTQVVEQLGTTERSPVTNDELKEQLQAAFDNDPIGTIAYLANQYSEQTVERKLASLQQQNEPVNRAQAEAQNEILAMTVDRDLSDRHTDWPEYRDRVADEIQKDPSLLDERILQSGPQATARALERVYKMVKADELLSRQESGNFVTDQMKRQAQTLSGQGGRPGEPSVEDEKFARLQAAAHGMSYSAFRGGT